MNPYSNIRKVHKCTFVVEWEVEGEYHIDQYYPAFVNYVIAEDENGEKWVHENAFPNDYKAAQRLAKRGNEAAFNCIKHWGYHEYFSLS